MKVDVRGDVVALELRRATRTELRPGVSEVSGWFEHATFPATYTERVCQACRTRINAENGAPMLKAELWRAVAPRDGLICSSCLKDRLHTLGSTGRPKGQLTLSDLIPCMLSLEWVLRHQPGWTGSKVFRDFVSAVVRALEGGS